MKVLVFTTVFPNSTQNNLGVFVKERMSRVSAHCDVKVLAPIPYFPLAGLIKEKYRHIPPYRESIGGLDVYHPKFYLIPGLLKFLDGYFLYLSSLIAARRIRRNFNFDIIDAHFAYPDGYAAILLGKYLNVPVTITLRGTINRLILKPIQKKAIRFALKEATKIFSVSQHLADLAGTAGIEPEKFTIIPNGIDVERFRLLDKSSLRKELGVSSNARVVMTVGGLVERKGQHFVIKAMPTLLKKHPNLIYIMVGGSSVEGDNTAHLTALVNRLGLQQHVRFVGEVPHDKVCHYLNTADVFALPTKFEGCPNVLIEANACGLPVVTTKVCGNAEFVRENETGFLVPYGDQSSLVSALDTALSKQWDTADIISFAHQRTWRKVSMEVYSNLSDILRK